VSGVFGRRSAHGGPDPAPIEEAETMRGPMRAIEAIVRGRVQGVGFRWFVGRQAGALDVTGWVENRSDGSVVVHAEGPPADVDLLVDAIREGPPGADVASIEVTEMDGVGRHDGFEIRSRGHTGD
jgi:acylphosphatase